MAEENAIEEYDNSPLVSENYKNDDKRKRKKNFLKQIPKDKKKPIRKDLTKLGNILIDLDFNNLMTNKVFCIYLYLRKRLVWLVKFPDAML